MDVIIVGILILASQRLISKKNTLQSRASIPSLNKLPVTNKIIGGTEAGTYPFMAALFDAEGFEKQIPMTAVAGGDNTNESLKDVITICMNDTTKDQCPQNIYPRFECGGSLIDKQFILTAAHCVIDGNSNFNYQNKRVVVGIHDLMHDNIDEKKIFLRGIQSVFLYDPSLIKSRSKDSWPHIILGDIALIKLDSPIMQIKPIKLKHIDFDFFLPVTELTDLTYIGWGLQNQK